MNMTSCCNKKEYFGQAREPFTPVERDRLKKFRACNDNELSLCQLREKSLLLAKELEELKHYLGEGI